MPSTSPRFIGRDQQLKRLNQLFNKKVASLVVVKGRRRIGKSRLIAEFAAGKPFVKILGIPPSSEVSAQAQREVFASALAERFDIPKPESDDWSTLFGILAEQTKQGPFIILLDELSWMGSQDPTFLGKLKTAWDEQFKENPQLVMVLCSSISPWMEKHVLSSTGYFGRVSQKITLDELSLSDSAALLKASGFIGSVYEKALLLMITGGVPWYIELIQPSITASENIQHLCFMEDGILLEEFNHIFHDLFERRGPTYKKIVSILGNGPASFKEISAATEYGDGGTLSSYLDALEKSGFVRKEHTWTLKTGKESRQARYRLRDNYLRFYLRYIEPNKNQIKRGRFGERSLLSLPAFDTVMGLQFENLVLNNQKLILQQLGVPLDDIIYDGPYFQQQNKSQKACQIDYLVQTRLGGLYVCEIKFTRSIIESEVVKEVQEKITRINAPKHYTCIPVLIHLGEVRDSDAIRDYFWKVIDVGEVFLGI